ncbi:Crp/Fnr family transcriptional regulator [Microlunatus sp. Gsoil 973]|uniref:Crp/Fnr family transcriptional regulator n=1 Tax=Microlunatus sp. Gsoil 973 TaxID=2672569 RepID=UPI0012B4D6D4|nr:Crp/Fnr family transcriptional regulator [Microlunatus sp. Gsoil 973]QGN34652.1 helix-turn-helix domain-containing protein [Microlunatus sp. Gsoil 973]
MIDVRSAAASGPLVRLPPEVLTRLLDGHTVIRAAAGGVLYRPGETAGLHLVVDGLVRVSMVSEGGRQVTVRYTRRGDVLGVPVIVSGPAPVFVQAVTDAVAVATRPGVLTQIARQDPRVGIWLADELAARVDSLLQELAMNAFWPVRRRLGRHLLDLAADDQQGDTLLVSASHQHLADAVGSVREVVARVLADLRSDGLVTAEPGGVRLLAPEALAALPGRPPTEP